MVWLEEIVMALFSSTPVGKTDRITLQLTANFRLCEGTQACRGVHASFSLRRRQLLVLSRRGAGEEGVEARATHSRLRKDSGFLGFANHFC